MQTAKLFKNGRGQAVRLPAELRFEGEEVQIRRDPETGDVILSPIDKSFSDWLEERDRLLASMTEEERRELVGLQSALERSTELETPGAIAADHCESRSTSARQTKAGPPHSPPS